MTIIQQIERVPHRLNTGLVNILNRCIDARLYKGSTDYQKYIVLGRSRVGSNLLATLLNDHSQVICLGEVFSGKRASLRGYYFGQTQKLSRLRHREPVSFVDDHLFRAHPVHIKAVGFKIFYYHVKGEQRDLLWSHLQNMKDLKVIHIKRKNILRTHVSLELARRTGRWTRGKSSAQGKQEPIELSYENCLDEFERTKRWEQEYDAHFEDHEMLDVHYESLIHDRDAELKKVQEFLNVPGKVLDTPMKKQNSAPLSELISNYDELRKHFEDTEWVRFFES